MLVHATAVALMKGKAWRAVLLRGQPGSGKSDLALRLIDQGGRLIADDQTRLARKGRALIATCPATLKSMIEVRGVGIVKLDRAKTIASAPLALLVDLVSAANVERLPDPASETVLGIAVRTLELAPFEASAAAKLRIAL
jgi:serine kinase of HPr protein (carbohydrate metabolism regulator)